MTMIVGLLCSDGIVLASETEETVGYTSKRQAYKLSLIEDPKWVMVIGTAGDSAVAENVLRKIDRMLDKHSGKKLTEEAIGNLLDEILAKAYTTYIDPDPKSEGLGLVIGAVSGEELFLISTHRRTPVFHHKDSPYTYAGLGGDLAVYFLDQLHESDRDCAFGINVAGFVMAEVKERTQLTSGDSDFFVIQRRPNPRWRRMGGDLTMSFDNNEKIHVGELIKAKFIDAPLTPAIDAFYRDEFHPNALSFEERMKLEQQATKQSASRK